MTNSDADFLKLDGVSYVAPFCRVYVGWLPSSFQLGRTGCAWKSEQDKMHQTMKADLTVIVILAEKTIFCVVMCILGIVEMINVW